MMSHACLGHSSFNIWRWARTGCDIVIPSLAHLLQPYVFPLELLYPTNIRWHITSALVQMSCGTWGWTSLARAGSCYESSQALQCWEAHWQGEGLNLCTVKKTMLASITVTFMISVRGRLVRFWKSKKEREMYCLLPMKQGMCWWHTEVALFTVLTVTVSDVEREENEWVHQVMEKHQTVEPNSRKWHSGLERSLS